MAEQSFSYVNSKARSALIVDLPNRWYLEACRVFPEHCVLNGRSHFARRFERVLVAVKHPPEGMLEHWHTLVRPGGEFIRLSDDEIAEIVSRIMPSSNTAEAARD